MNIQLPYPNQQHLQSHSPKQQTSKVGSPRFMSNWLSFFQELNNKKQELGKKRIELLMKLQDLERERRFQEKLRHDRVTKRMEEVIGNLERRISKFVEYYNHERYHESLDNLTPADVFYGRGQKVLNKREKIKIQTMALRKQMHYRKQSQHNLMR